MADRRRLGCWHFTSQARHRLPGQSADGRSVEVLVGSDGAGTASRGDEGSSITCRAIQEAVEVHLANGRRIGDIDLSTARTWVGMVQTAIAFRAERAGMVSRDYACTLLAAFIGEDATAFLQIGDGAIVVSDQPGEWAWVYWPQRGEFANTTYFVTEKAAENRLDFDMPTRPLEEVALFTDGLENLVLHHASKTVHARFFDKAFAPVRCLENEGMDAELSMKLERYLRSPAVCERTDDDKTLILATRRHPKVALNNNSFTA